MPENKTYYAFPFKISEYCDYKSLGIPESETTVIRGILCARKVFKPNLPIQRDNGKVLSGIQIVYWHPVTSPRDTIEDGLILAEKGLDYLTPNI